MKLPKAGWFRQTVKILFWFCFSINRKERREIKQTISHQCKSSHLEHCQYTYRDESTATLLEIPQDLFDHVIIFISTSRIIRWRCQVSWKKSSKAPGMEVNLTAHAHYPVLLLDSDNLRGKSLPKFQAICNGFLCFSSSFIQRLYVDGVELQRKMFLKFQVMCTRYTVPKITHTVFSGNASECRWEHDPWQINFRRRFNPSPSRNFWKHLTHFPSEISKKSREEKKNSTVFNLLSSWFKASHSYLYSIALYVKLHIFFQFHTNFI